MMTMVELRDNIVNLFGRSDEELPETPLPKTSPARPNDDDEQPRPTAIDLTGRRKLIMTFGPGNSGKSTTIRWMVERGMERECGRLALLTADTERPVLLSYFDGAKGPAPGADVDRWIERALKALMRNPCTAVVDFGADVSLRGLMREVPDLLKMLVDADITPVAFYLLTPRQLDLTVLDGMEKVGFQPEATALIANLGTVAPGTSIDGQFAALRRHTVYREAVARGAFEIEMPRLFAAKAVEDRLPLSFLDAAKGKGVDIWDASRVRSWLAEMEMAFKPVASWLPD